MTCSDVSVCKELNTDCGSDPEMMQEDLGPLEHSRDTTGNSGEGSESSGTVEPDDDEFNLEDASGAEGASRSDSEASSASSQEEILQSQGEDGTAGQPVEEQPAEKTMAAAFAEILAHPGPANSKHKAPILLVHFPLERQKCYSPALWHLEARALFCPAELKFYGCEDLKKVFSKAEKNAW